MTDELAGRTLEITACKAAGYTMRYTPFAWENDPSRVYDYWALIDPQGQKCLTRPGSGESYSMAACMRNSEEDAWESLAPFYLTDAAAAMGLMNTGVERFGGAEMYADMEEWKAGGLYWFRFAESPPVFWHPFCEAVCRAFLAAVEAQEKANPAASASASAPPRP